MSKQDIKSMGLMLRNVQDPRLKPLLELIIANIKRLDNNDGEKLTIPADGWVDLPLEQNWVHFAAGSIKPKFYKDAQSFVHIHGVIEGGTTADHTVIATLPVGYRPEADTAYPIADHGSNKAAMVIIRSNGDIEIDAVTNNTELSIAGMFYATR